MKDYGHILRDDPAYAVKAKRVSELTQDISEWLPELSQALRERVKDVRLTESDSVTFRIGTVAVVWGDAEQPERKARLIEILLREKPKVIDVSAPETPVTT